MILKRRVSLGGVQLDSLDNRILISGIDEAAGKDNITAVASANGSGQRIVKTRRDTLDVTVKFTLNIKSKNMKARAELLEKINAWAAPGGWLKVNYRPERQLMVVLAQAPGGGDMFNWTNEFTMVFRAYAVPYWDDITAAAVQSKTASSGSMTLEVPGSAETVAGVKIVNKSGKVITNFTVTIGGKMMKFSNSNLLPADGTVTIDHKRTAGEYYLRAYNASRSVLLYRTKESADDYNIKPGKVAISFSAQRAVQVTVSAKGRYL